MTVVFVVVLALAGVAVYLYLCMLAVVFATTPLTLAAVVGGVLAGVAVTLIHTLAVLAGRSGTELRTPADVAAGRLAGRVRPRQVRRDRSWPQYFAIQVGLDLERAVGQSRRSVMTLWSASRRAVGRVPTLVALALWPVVVPVAVFLLAYTAGTVVGVTAVLVVVAAVTAVAWSAGMLTVGLLRAVDRVWQLLARAGGSCPRCHEVSRLPAYRCPGPHPAEDRRDGWDLHRDVRPGQLGVLWRRCGCGTRLSTMVLRASRSMQPCCPRCGEPLHRGAAVDTDVRIPVFGAASAGKTHLIMAGLVTLLRSAGGGKLRISTADERSERLYRGYAELVDAGGSAPKTDPAQPAVALTLRLHNGLRRAMLHVYDAAGEALADPDQHGRFAYLDYARTFVFVIDPFSIKEVRDQFAGTFAELFALANAAADDPELSYQVTVGRLRAHGVRTERKRLAFVVSKRDLLDELPIAQRLDGESGSIRRWLMDRRLDNLVTAAERDFREVRFFVASAKRHRDAASAVEPFRWLLACERVGVPEPRPEPGVPEARPEPVPEEVA
jgi:hypothetical protein